MNGAAADVAAGSRLLVEGNQQRLRLQRPQRILRRNAKLDSSGDDRSFDDDGGDDGDEEE